MIQFNLLPDIKIEYMRTKRLKRIIIIVSIAACAVSLAILIGMFSLNAAQKRHLNNLNEDIKKLTAEINDIPDLNKILTVQKQLNTLPSLYEGRPAVKRLPDYLKQTTPAKVGLTNVTIDFTTGALTLGGTADSVPTINQYVDTLKFTSFKLEGSDTTLPAFTNVVLTSYGTGKNPGFSISLNFDLQLFDARLKPSLVIPQGVTTRSQLELPGNDLFLNQAGGL